MMTEAEELEELQQDAAENQPNPPRELMEKFLEILPPTPNQAGFNAN